MNKYIYKTSLLLAIIALPTMALAQAKPSAGLSFFNLDTVLIILALTLLLPIIILSKTLIAIVTNKIENEKSKLNNANKIGIIALLIFTSLQSMAQDMTIPIPAGNTIFDKFSTGTWMLIIGVLLELIVVISLSKKVYSLLQINPLKEATETENWWQKAKTKFMNYWVKVNNFIPISEEDKIDSGHSYDGIRELNNPAPIWFKVSFLLSILFAIAYLWRYHVAQSAPMQIEEFNIAVAQGEKEKEEYLSQKADNVDENSVAMLDKDGIQAGQNIFDTKCVACHLKGGAGLSGPNLTDEFWIHGGSLKDIFKSIKYGWVDKGMREWQSELSGVQIAQVSSYIKSIKGTNPPNAKAPQGEKFVEAGTTSTDSTAKVPSQDTTKK